MNKTLSIQATWRWPAFLVLHAVAFALLLSWIPEAGRSAWRQAGSSLFLALHGTLGSYPLWDAWWALCSTRLWDALSGLLMLALIIHSGFVFKQQPRRALLHLLTLLAVLLVFRVVFSKLVGHFHWQHQSPGLVFTDVFRLSEAFPDLEHWFEVKDRSSRSFPGDHASVLLLWGVFMSCFCRGWKFILCWSFALFCIVPRLLAGAHWLDDVAVGGVFLATLAFAWGYCTPLGDVLASALERLAQPFLPWLRKIPLIGRWQVLA